MPPYPAWADEYVYYAANLIKRINEAKSQGKVVHHSGPLGYAFQLYSSLKQSSGQAQIKGPALAAVELEGYVLANIPQEEVSKLLGLPQSVVEWYEKLFFDVRDRLDSVAWVSGNVIGAVYGTTVEALIPMLARSYGYYTKDPVLIRVFLRGMDSDGVGAASNAGGPLMALQHDTRVALALKAGLVTRLVNMDSRAFRSVMEMHNKMTEIARLAGERDGSENKYVEAAKRLLGGGSADGAIQWDYKAAPRQIEGETADDRSQAE